MFTLIKNADIYAPEKLGTTDVLVCGERVAWMGRGFPAEATLPGLEVLDADGLILMPGIVDGHVHITGGGGEGGAATRTPELVLSDMIRGGVTTVIGLTGTDDVTRSMGALIAKANGLIAEGVSAWVLTGSYQLPIKTLCGGIRDDITLIDRVIGVGEVAISDHRSSQPTYEEFMNIAAAARVGGMFAGIGGQLCLHLGDGESGIDYLFRAAKSEIPMSQFVPTHMNRNPRLFEEGRRYAKMGGYVDFTTSTTPRSIAEGERTCSVALRTLLEDGVHASRISFTSDGQGSMPVFDSAGNYKGLTIGRVTSNLEAFRESVLQEGVSIEDAVWAISTTTAEHYRLPRKGRVKESYDADLILTDDKFNLKYVFARGRKMMDNGVVLVKGTFE